MKKAWHAGRIALIGLLLGCWAVAAGPISTPMTIKKTDGTTVTGQLLIADADSVILLPAGKKDGVSIAWKDVSTTSNGLSRHSATAMWRHQHQDRLCGTCEGAGTVAHEMCQAKGIDPEKVKPCVPCKGAGVVGKCTNAKCTDGKIECPGDCIKRSVGKWIQRDGVWHREFKSPKYVQWVSVNHLGELFTWNPTNGYEPKVTARFVSGPARWTAATALAKGNCLVSHAGGPVRLALPVRTAPTAGRLALTARANGFNLGERVPFNVRRWHRKTA